MTCFQVQQYFDLHPLDIHSFASSAVFSYTYITFTILSVCFLLSSNFTFVDDAVLGLWTALKAFRMKMGKKIVSPSSTKALHFSRLKWIVTLHKAMLWHASMLWSLTNEWADDCYVGNLAFVGRLVQQFVCNLFNNLSVNPFILTADQRFMVWRQVRQNSVL